MRNLVGPVDESTIDEESELHASAQKTKILACDPNVAGTLKEEGCKVTQKPRSLESPLAQAVSCRNALA